MTSSGVAKIYQENETLTQENNEAYEALAHICGHLEETCIASNQEGKAFIVHVRDIVLKRGLRVTDCGSANP
jgi:hypothetical protein